MIPLLFVCVCMLAAADEPPATAPTVGLLSGIVDNLQRRLLRATAPKQLELQDALDIKHSEEFLAGPAFYSSVSGRQWQAVAPSDI